MRKGLLIRIIACSLMSIISTPILMTGSIIKYQNNSVADSTSIFVSGLSDGAENMLSPRLAIVQNEVQAVAGQLVAIKEEKRWNRFSVVWKKVRDLMRWERAVNNIFGAKQFNDHQAIREIKGLLRDHPDRDDEVLSLHSLFLYLHRYQEFSEYAIMDILIKIAASSKPQEVVRLYFRIVVDDNGFSGEQLKGLLGSRLFNNPMEGANLVLAYLEKMKSQSLSPEELISRLFESQGVPSYLIVRSRLDNGAITPQNFSETNIATSI